MTAPRYTQGQLAALANGQRRTERMVAGMVAQVQQRIEDDWNVSPELRDAVRLPVAVLALPRNIGRFIELVADLES